MIAQTAASVSAFVPPEVQWNAVVPLLVVLGAGVVGVLVEAFAPAGRRRTIQVPLTLVSLVAAFLVIVWQGVRYFGEDGSGSVSVLGGAVVIDGVALMFQGTIVLVAFLSLLVVVDRTAAHQDAFAPSAASIPGSDYEELARRKGLEQTEVFPLLMFAVGGMLIFPAASDLLTMFVALEVLSLPLYVMSGMARRRRLLSQEASFKYFVLGAFASAVFLFGAALLYGYSGSVRLGEIGVMSEAVRSGDLAGGQVLWVLGFLMVVVGLLFKVGAVPFQAWVPDVYQGAPTPITGFMAACTKIAAFGALVRIVWLGGFTQGTVEMATAIKTGLWVVAIATMVVGAIVGATQTDMKRMLGYSSIAHAGFVLVGILSFNGEGVKAVVFYLLAYGLATVGAFAVVTLVRETGRGGEVLGEATHLGQWAGLGRRSPWLAVCFSIFLLSFAGIPLTAGFIGKFSVFRAAIIGSGSDALGDGTVLAVVGVLASAVAVFFYIRVIVIMFFTSPPEADVPPAGAVQQDASPTTAVAAGTVTQTLSPAQTSVLVAEGAPSVTVVRSEGPTAVAVTVCAVLVVALGIFPTPVLDLVARLLNLG